VTESAKLIEKVNIEYIYKRILKLGSFQHQQPSGLDLLADLRNGFPEDR